MRITQTFTLTRTEVAAFREQSSQAIDLLKPLAAELMGEQKTEAQAAKLLEQLKTSITVDVKVANKLSTVGYLLRIKDDVEVVLTVDVDDEVFTELMAYGVDLLKDYMGILKAMINLVVNLKELQADSELRSTHRLVALKERMGDDQTSVKVNGDEMVNELKEAHEKDEYVYPYWTVSQEDQVSDVLSIDADSGVNDIQALLLELSLERPDKVLTLSASARVRMVVKNGEVIKSSKFEDFYIMDEEVKEEAKIFNNLVPASHDGMGNFKTK